MRQRVLAGVLARVLAGVLALGLAGCAGVRAPAPGPVTGERVMAEPVMAEPVMVERGVEDAPREARDCGDGIGGTGCAID